MREIAAKFKARFGITLEHLAGSSSQLAARLETERLAGINSVDVFLGGVQTVANVLYPEKMLDPLKPQLILPEVVEPKRWKKGKLWFADPEKRYVLRVYSTITGLLHINTDHVKPGDLTKAADLLQPKWRGKVATEDPTVAGSGSNTAARIYLQMGEDFVRRLYVTQKAMIARDRRQLTDWLARGTYPIVFAAQSSDVERMRKEGFPLKEIYGFTDMPPALTGSPWLLALMNKAPHSMPPGSSSTGSCRKKDWRSMPAPRGERHCAPTPTNLSYRPSKFPNRKSTISIRSIGNLPSAEKRRYVCA